MRRDPASHLLGAASVDQQWSMRTMLLARPARREDDHPRIAGELRRAGRREPGEADHSITRSARRRRESGILSASAFAVLRLMTSSKLVGCSIGRLAGLAPLRIRSTKSAARR